MVLTVIYLLHLILIEKPSWLHVKMNKYLFAFIYTWKSIAAAAEEISSTVLFSTNAQELYQRLIDQLNGIRWRIDWE